MGFVAVKYWPAIGRARRWGSIGSAVRAGVGASSATFLIETLKQVVGGEFDVFVVKFRCSVMASDET